MSAPHADRSSSIRLWFSCLIAVTALSNAAVASSALPAIDEILRACQRNPAYTKSLSMTVHVALSGEGKLAGAGGNVDTYTHQIQRTPGVIDVKGSSVILDSEGKEYPETRHTIRERVVGKVRMHRQPRDADGDPDVVIDRASDDAIAQLLFDVRFGWLLDGYFFGMKQQSVVQLLTHAEEVEIADVENSSFVYVKGQTPQHGLVEAWFDSDHEYLLRKYRLSKADDDHFDDTPLRELPAPKDAPPTISWIAETSEFNVKVIDDVAMPVSGTLTLTVTHPDGSVNISRNKVWREDIEYSVDPELEQFSSFIPEGANVIDREHPGMQYAFRCGELIPYFNTAAIGQIDALLESFANYSLNDRSGGDSAIRVDDNAYCGLYCVYAAARSFGLNPDVYALFQPQHIGAAEGSSLPELVLASEAVGLKGRAIGGLSPGDLRAMQLPIILHVRESSRAVEPDHFVLLLRMDGRDTTVLYPPSSMTGPRIESTPLPILAANWGRSAILLTDSEQPAKGLISSQRRTLVMAAVMTLFVFGLIGLRSQFPAVFANPASESAQGVVWSIVLIAGLSILGAAGAAVLQPDGIRSTESTWQAANLLHERQHPPVVEATDLPDLLQATRSVHFIDARRGATRSTIPGSRQVPYDASSGERSQMMSGISKNARIIVFCNPHGCPVSARLAVHLEDAGYSNVQVLRGDWSRYVTVADGNAN